MSRVRAFLALIAFLTMSLALLVGRGATEARQNQRTQAEARRLAAALQLTDLAPWGEARYTRHPSQADLFTPFQDFPAAPEHFPAGSLLSPEPLRRSLAQRAIGD